MLHLRWAWIDHRSPSTVYQEEMFGSQKFRPTKNHWITITLHGAQGHDLVWTSSYNRTICIIVQTASWSSFLVHYEMSQQLLDVMQWNVVWDLKFMFLSELLNVAWTFSCTKWDWLENNFFLTLLNTFMHENFINPRMGTDFPSRLFRLRIIPPWGKGKPTWHLNIKREMMGLKVHSLPETAVDRTTSPETVKKQSCVSLFLCWEERSLRSVSVARLLLSREWLIVYCVKLEKQYSGHFCAA